MKLEDKLLLHFSKFAGARAYLNRIYNHKKSTVLPGIDTHNKMCQTMQKSMYDSLKWIVPKNENGLVLPPFQTKTSDFLRTVPGTLMDPMTSIGIGEASHDMLHPSGLWLHYLKSTGKIVGSNATPVNISIGKISVSGFDHMTKDLTIKRDIVAEINDTDKVNKFLDACHKWHKTNGDFRLFAFLVNNMNMYFMYKEARRSQVDSVVRTPDGKLAPKPRSGTDWIQNYVEANKYLPDEYLLDDFVQFAMRSRFAWGLSLNPNIIFNVAGSYQRGAFKSKELAFSFTHNPHELAHKFRNFPFITGSDIGRFDTTQGIDSTIEYMRATGLYDERFLSAMNAMLSGVALIKNDHLGESGNKFSKPLKDWRPNSEQGGTSGHGLISENNKGLGAAVMFTYLDLAFKRTNSARMDFERIYMVKTSMEFPMFSDDHMRVILKGLDPKMITALAGDDSLFGTNVPSFNSAYRDPSNLEAFKVVKLQLEEEAVFLGNIICLDKKKVVAYPNSFTYLRNGYMPEYDITSSNRKNLWRYGRLQARVHHLTNPTFHHFIEAEDKAFRDVSGKGSDLMRDVFMQPDILADFLLEEHFNVWDIEFMNNPSIIFYKVDPGMINPKLFDLMFFSLTPEDLRPIAKAIINPDRL